MRSYRDANLEKMREYDRAQYAKRPDVKRESKRKSYHKHRETRVNEMREKAKAIRESETPEQRIARLEKERIRVRARYIRNKDSILARGKEYREQNREKRRETVKNSTKKNSVKRKVYESSYHEKNRDRTKAYNASRRHIRADQLRRRREIDSNFRILTTLRSRMAAAIRVVKGTKAHKTDALVGCNIVLLRAYLQSLFKPGMTWENYGEWHVDHKIPCAEFDLRDPAQQLLCFHFSNLQPLWAVENLRKARKLVF